MGLTDKFKGNHGQGKSCGCTTNHFHYNNVVPWINPANNHWMIGNQDTGVPATGGQGETVVGPPGQRGNEWFTVSSNTETTPPVDSLVGDLILNSSEDDIIIGIHTVPAGGYVRIVNLAPFQVTPILGVLKGQRGDDGDTPYIGGNGNWFIDGVDTGVKATGEDGQDGRSVEYRFAKSSDPNTPPDLLVPSSRTPVGWELNVPIATSSEYVWGIMATINPDNTLYGTWTTQFRYTGDRGPSYQLMTQPEIDAGVSEEPRTISANILNNWLSDKTYSKSETDDLLSDKADLIDGLIPAWQLPSFVDDVLNGTYISPTVFNNTEGDPYEPEDGKIYVDVDYNLSYRWTGLIYARLDQSVALGETASTAYRGDRGKIAYDHSQIISGNPHGTTLQQATTAGNTTNVTSIRQFTGLDSEDVSYQLGKEFGNNTMTALGWRYGGASPYGYVETRGTRPFIINPSGNFVGIGKLNPATLLDVNGTVTAPLFQGSLLGAVNVTNSTTVSSLPIILGTTSDGYSNLVTNVSNLNYQPSTGTLTTSSIVGNGWGVQGSGTDIHMYNSNTSGSMVFRPNGVSSSSGQMLLYKSGLVSISSIETSGNITIPASSFYRMGTQNVIGRNGANTQLISNGSLELVLATGGVLFIGGATTQIANLVGTGTRMVVANNSGQLSTQAIPSGGSIELGSGLYKGSDNKINLGVNPTTLGTTNIGALTQDTILARVNSSGQITGLFQILDGSLRSIVQDTVDAGILSDIIVNKDSISIEQKNGVKISGFYANELSNYLGMSRVDGSDTQEMRFQDRLSGGFMEITDDFNEKGLEYKEDYSANFTDNSLVSKKWVMDYVASLL